MRQQINLYQPIFRHQEKIFSGKAMLQGVAMISAGLLLFYGYALVQSRNLQGQLQQMEAQRSEDIRRIAELNRLYPEQQKDPALEQRLQTVREELEHKRGVVAVLTNRAMGNRSGFSAHLEGLARQRLSQLWLTEVSIEQGGERLSLIGSSFQQEQVPQFIQRLNQEPPYAGREFAVFAMERQKEDPRRIDFRIRSVPEEKPA